MEPTTFDLKIFQSTLNEVVIQKKTAVWAKHVYYSLL